ncbi:response regulator, partial [Klebsiella pneumoniae]|uniref:response regulator n=1 Tax=Klebsiella pneumoniae TaxID=573 RepID=UPI003EE32565
MVEDDSLLAAGIVDNLRAEGYGVHHVMDGQLALDWLADEQCGLIVLDVMLPRVDGFTVCRNLRQRGDST